MLQSQFYNQPPPCSTNQSAACAEFGCPGMGRIQTTAWWEIFRVDLLWIIIQERKDFLCEMSDVSFNGLIQIESLETLQI